MPSEAHGTGIVADVSDHGVAGRCRSKEATVEESGHIADEIPDRGASFDLAVALAERGDVIVAAGRGSDTVQRYGSQVTHFDDRTQLHRAITRALARR